MRQTGAHGGAHAAPARALLGWFARHRRALPWRTSRDPYRIWIAEVLLQQTRVAQAAPYFARFVARFPSVGALARASEGEVLKTLEGAGYYARARRLREAARVLLEWYDGHLPRSVEELEQLPGVGPYTARAIAALAFDVPCVALEANGLRVAARWTAEEGDVRSPAVRRRLEAHLLDLVPPRQAGRFNEAIMELGETVCLPSSPRGDTCPVESSCRARQELSDPATLPRRRPPPRRPHVRAAVVVLERRGRWLVQRRPSRGLLGGLWEFPGGKIEPGETPVAAARRELREEVGLEAGELTPWTTVRHGYSHFSVELHVFRGTSTGRVRASPSRAWVTASELEALPLPRATQKIVAGLTERRPART